MAAPLKKYSSYITAHKLTSAALAFAIFVGSYWVYGKMSGSGDETRYVLDATTRGTLVVSLSASGQVTAVNQIDVKSKASGDVAQVRIVVGQTVANGVVLARLDDTDARKAIADAEIGLTEAKLQLDRDTAQAPIDYARKRESLESAKEDVIKEYEDAFITVSNAFLDLPAVVTGVEGVLFGKNIEPTATQWNIDVYKNLYDKEDGALITTLAAIAEKDYRAVRPVYDANLGHFKNTTRYAERPALEALLAETLETTRALAQTIKSETNLLDTIVDVAERKAWKPHAFVAASRANLKNYLNTVNGNVSALLGQRQSLENAKQAIVNVERDISILEVNNPSGVLPISLQIAQNNIRKKETALADLKADLADYIIRAPYGGIAAKVNVKRGDTVSGNTVVATIVSSEKFAETSLNEIDAARVALGQKATLTFDAIEGLTLTGAVSEIDTVGTIAQGVVTYNVKVRFDAQDDRVKPGMSVNIAIITDSKTDVLMVPVSAVKSRGETRYVQMIGGAAVRAFGGQGVTSDAPPLETPVTTGIANDTSIEILFGLNEGDVVVVRTITATAQSTTAQSEPAIRIPGLPGGGSRR